MSKNTKEPVVLVGSIGSVTAAVIAVLVAFGVPFSEGQTQAILGLVAVAGPLVTAFIARRHVTPIK